MEKEDLENLNFLEEYYENLKDFENSKENEELCLEFVEMEKIYNLLVTEHDIENMISKLEILEILGENILKYWEKDKVFCEIKIKNPEYIIKTKNGRKFIQYKF